MWTLTLNGYHIRSIDQQTSMTLSHWLVLYCIDILIRTEDINVQLGIAIRIHRQIACHVMRTNVLHRAKRVIATKFATL